MKYTAKGLSSGWTAQKRVQGVTRSIIYVPSHENRASINYKINPTVTLENLLKIRIKFKSMTSEEAKGIGLRTVSVSRNQIRPWLASLTLLPLSHHPEKCRRISLAGFSRSSVAFQLIIHNNLTAKQQINYLPDSRKNITFEKLIVAQHTKNFPPVLRHTKLHCSPPPLICFHHLRCTLSMEVVSINALNGLWFYVSVELCHLPCIHMCDMKIALLLSWCHIVRVREEGQCVVNIKIQNHILLSRPTHAQHMH